MIGVLAYFKNNGYYTQDYETTDKFIDFEVKLKNTSEKKGIKIEGYQTGFDVYTKMYLDITLDSDDESIIRDWLESLPDFLNIKNLDHLSD